MYVRRLILLFLTCVIFFILPLQLFIIGDFSGIGVQGAAYRFQISGYGTSFIPITRELMFVYNGTYSGKTALSLLAWIAGTALLTCTAAFSLLYINNTQIKYYNYIMYGLVGSCVLYLTSCIAQYGPLFNGPAGISFPVGIILILLWVILIYRYPKFFCEKDPALES
jgi:hypothetical protein